MPAPIEIDVRRLQALPKPGCVGWKSPTRQKACGARPKGRRELVYQLSYCRRPFFRTNDRSSCKNLSPPRAVAAARIEPLPPTIRIVKPTPRAQTRTTGSDPGAATAKAGSGTATRPKSTHSAKAVAPPEPPAELVEFEAMQKRLDDLKRVAVMNPTDANLLSLHALPALRHGQVRKLFAERWQRLVWSVPDLDYGLTGRPTNAMAIGAFDDQQRDRQGQLVRNLASTHGCCSSSGATARTAIGLAPIPSASSRNTA